MDTYRLPINISSFRKIREEGYYYVDKTALIHEMVDRCHHYFLARPRGFGKTVLVDTLQALFAGHEELFRGLHIHDNWDWNTQYPVVRLSFDGHYHDTDDLKRQVHHQLAALEQEAGIEASDYEGGIQLQNLLHRIHHATGQQIVVLVDDYDKPYLDALPNRELAQANRDYMHGFLGILKNCEARFVVVTGVSVLTIVTFSGLNNLNDITLNRRFASLCGYTDADLDTAFVPEWSSLNRETTRHRYLGYRWGGDEPVYNPVDILQLFQHQQFRPYWYETESPKLLFHYLQEKNITPMQLDRVSTPESCFRQFVVERLNGREWLFQMGYVTIKAEEESGFETTYTLDYPNPEVRERLNSDFLEHLDQPEERVSHLSEELCSQLAKQDFAGFAERLCEFISGIAWDWLDSDDPACHARWYTSMLYSCLQSTRLDCRVEPTDYHQSSDLVLMNDTQVFVLRIRLTEREEETASILNEAMERMRKLDYAQQYRDRAENIHLIVLALHRQGAGSAVVRSQLA